MTPDDDASRREENATRTANPVPPGAGGAPRGNASPPVSGWDRYEFLGFLGDGGMGRVWKAWDPRLKRHVALKFLRGGDDPAMAARFQREAQAQATVDHERVCKVYEVGKAFGKPYIAMQYIPGAPLAEVAREMTLEQRLLVLREAARGLHAAHRCGLLHRDVKPGNILVERAESGAWKPYVVDFGIARDLADTDATVTGGLTGTPFYMAPEQLRGDVRRLDRRADVYGLGATLYEALSGHPPFAAPDLPTLLRQVTEDVPPSLRKLDRSIPADVDAIVQKCLRKEPGERYPSTRALADDLQRYMDGEPVEARPTTMWYRLRRRAARNRLTVVVSGVALTLLMVTVAWGGYARWNSARRVRLAQSFGREVERVESLIRVSHMAPLHDIRGEKADVRNRIAGIREQMKQIGRVAQGPGRYALGRGHLALGEYEAARAELERAWALGYHEPEAAYALGRTLGELYRRARTEAEQIADTRTREARLLEIERSLRDPALGFLRQSAGVEVDAPGYVEALLAFYEGRHDEARAKAREAVRRAPWLYESERLIGDIALAEAQEATNRGRLDLAKEAYGKAESAYRASSSVGRSDPEVYAARCELGRSRMRSAINGRGEDVVPYFERGRAACQAALRADPDDVRALYLEAELLHRLGQYRRSTGENPARDLEEAVSTAERAIALDPQMAAAHASLAGASRELAAFLDDRGEDPMQALNRAVTAYRKAVELDPSNFRILNDLGVTYKTRARHVVDHGGDPTPDLERAIAAYGRSLERNAEGFAANTNLGVALFHLATYRMEHGKEAREDLERSAAALDRASEINPTSIAVFYQMGRVLVTLAGLEEEKGADPTPRLREAEESFGKALAVNDASPYVAHIEDGLGGVFQSLATYQVSHARDPRHAFDQAVEAYERAIQANPNYFWAYSNLGFALCSRAEFEVDHGGAEPLVWIRRALDACNRATEIKPNFAEAWVNLAEAWRVHARDRIGRGVDPAQSFRNGERALHAALEIHPDLPYAAAARERLAALEHRWKEEGPRLQGKAEIAADR